MIYFDHNATTPLLEEAKQAWLEAAEQYIGNPSSPHRLGKRADKALMTAREHLASHLGCDPMDIVWTSGATEANNWVFHQLKETLPVEQEVWLSAIEHPCVLNAARHYFGPRVRLIPAERSGAVDMNWLKAELPRHPPGAVAVLAANNETGVLQPWEECLDLCRAWKVPYFCDAAQWLGKLPPGRLGECDCLTGCGHKFGGPKGVGFVKYSGESWLRPLFHGGPQEEGRRAGTENLPGVVAFSAALAACEKRLEQKSPRSLAEPKDRFERELLARLPDSEIVGWDQTRLWNTASLLMPEVECQSRWLVKLDKRGYAVSTGSACASGKEEPSHVLAAMGYPQEQSDRVLRFSSGWGTSEEDWQSLLKATLEVYEELQGSHFRAPS